MRYLDLHDTIEAKYYVIINVTYVTMTTCLYVGLDSAYCYILVFFRGGSTNSIYGRRAYTTYIREG